MHEHHEGGHRIRHEGKGAVGCTAGVRGFEVGACRVGVGEGTVEGLRGCEGERLGGWEITGGSGFTI